MEQVVSGVPSPVIVIDAMPAVELADTATLTLPFGVDPFCGELITTLGGEPEPDVAAAGVVTDTADDWADALPAAS